MTKFQRNYNLKIEIFQNQKENNALEIKFPLTLEFAVSRSTSSNLNRGIFKIYNLSEKNRNLIFQDRFSIKNINGNRRRITLQAGYKNLSTIFIGDILEAHSFREGANIITSINAIDGGFASYNNYINETLEKNLSFKDIFLRLGQSLGLSFNKVGDIEGASKRGVALNGNTFSLMKEKYRDSFFIDLDKVNHLNLNEVIKGDLTLLESSSGLLGTPQRQGSILIAKMLFEPRILIGQLVEIESQINKFYNGQFKVVGLNHDGIISGAVNGQCTTTLQLFIGEQILGELKTV